MDDLWVPSSLLGAAKHQECVCKISVETDKDMPHRMTLGVDRPSWYILAENTINEPKYTTKEKGRHIKLANPLSRGILCMNIVLVHPRNTDEAEDCVVDSYAYAKPENWMDNCKGNTVKEEEGRHRTAIVPVWWVQDIHIQEHFPYSWSFIALLLPVKKESPICWICELHFHLIEQSTSYHQNAGKTNKIVCATYKTNLRPHVSHICEVSNRSQVLLT